MINVIKDKDLWPINYLWLVDLGLTSHQQLRSQSHPTDWRSPGSNLRPLIYKASDITTAPRRLLIIYGNVKVMKDFKNVYDAPRMFYPTLKTKVKNN